MTYPTEYLFLNTSDADSVVLYENGLIQPNSTDIDPEAGTIVFSTDELNNGQFFVAVVTFTVTNSVESAQSYDVPHLLDWHNLPYDLDGGRYYNKSGEQTITIRSSQLSMVYITSNEHTPGNVVQLQEYISVNVSITLPEVSFHTYHVENRVYI